MNGIGKAISSGFLQPIKVLNLTFNSGCFPETVRKRGVGRRDSILFKIMRLSCLHLTS